jgi:hypothetical protein
VTLATNDRVLIKNQASGGENGIYRVNASGAPTRTSDANTAAEYPKGFAVVVREGTANGGSVWLHTTTAAITLGTTALTFAEVGGGGGGGTLTVAEVDGTPSVSATTLQFPNGTLSDEGGGVARYHADTVLLDRQAVGAGGSASVTLTPGSGYHSLEIHGLIRGEASQSSVSLYVRFNADTGTNYDSLFQGMYSDGTRDDFGWDGGSAMEVGYVMADTAPAGAATHVTLKIPAYRNTTFHKGVTSHMGGREFAAAAGYRSDAGAGSWRNTAAVTSVTLLLATGDIAEGSEVLLFGKGAA